MGISVLEKHTQVVILDVMDDSTHYTGEIIIMWYTGGACYTVKIRSQLCTKIYCY